MNEKVRNRHSKLSYSLMTKDELEEFLDLMELSFKDSLEADRVNIPEIRKIMKKTYKPIAKILMKLMRVKNENYLGKIDEKIVSGITLSIERNEANIGNVMTHPDYRRRGYARILFSFVIKRAIELKAKRLFLSVDADNVGAIKLYESEEFERNYHSGLFECNQLIKPNNTNNLSEITVKEISRINYENMNMMLDDCFPAFYFETRNRKRFIKKYIPSKFIKLIARKVAGQIIKTYGFFLQDEEKPRGYIQISYSNAEERIRLTSPILRNDNNKILPLALYQLIQLESLEEMNKPFALKISMHRDETISLLSTLGFAKKKESLVMEKKLESIS